MQEKDPKKTIVFAPLNWGLGHASRIIPLVLKYQEQGFEIILASDGAALVFLQKEFPLLEIIDVGSEELKYSKYPFLIFHLWKIIPRFLRNIARDFQFANQLTQDRKVDLMISDNRYGFRHKDVKSIIITHQLQLAIPKYLNFVGFLVQNRLNQWLNRFDECWIVDDKEHRLAGALSDDHQIKIPTRFLGLQSRLQNENVISDLDFLVVLSGLEPQRSIFEQLIIKVFEGSSSKVVIVGGTLTESVKSSSLNYIPFADSAELNKLINRAACIICRSGFSSIMDLIKLNKKAILIATPGQTEQEYLANFHRHNTNFKIAKNNEQSLTLAIKSLAN